jgi:anti-sigma-K factor RskA
MDEEMQELLALYALGALGAEERTRVERYLEADPAALAQAREYQETAHALSYIAQPVAPAAASKRALFQRLRRESGAVRPPVERAAGRGPRLLPGWAGRLAPALSLLVAAVSLGGVLATRTELAQVKAQNSELTRQLADYQVALGLLGAPDLLTLAIEGTEAAPQASANLIAETEARSGVLLVSGLPALEPGFTYQAWLIREGTPTPAGLFAVSENGSGSLALVAPEALGLYDAVAVSLEPAVGSLLPTGAIVLLGSMSG